MKSAKKDPKDKKVSAGIKRFLAQKEEEEKQKKKEAIQRKQKLLELRNQDKKSKRTANSMLQRTKSSNKSVLADAVNNRDTADTMNGPEQCDEDDYGYESKEAKELFGKLMSK